MQGRSRRKTKDEGPSQVYERNPVWWSVIVILGFREYAWDFEPLKGTENTEKEPKLGELQ